MDEDVKSHRKQKGRMGEVAVEMLMRRIRTPTSCGRFFLPFYPSMTVKRRRSLTPAAHSKTKSVKSECVIKSFNFQEPVVNV